MELSRPSLPHLSVLVRSTEKIQTVKFHCEYGAFCIANFAMMRCHRYWLYYLKTPLMVICGNKGAIIVANLRTRKERQRYFVAIISHIYVPVDGLFLCFLCRVREYQCFRLIYLIVSYRLQSKFLLLSSDYPNGENSKEFVWLILL